MADTNANDMPTCDKCLVIKPWGREYCAYRNERVAMWVMEIDAGKQTSLHAHPRKSTAFVVLRGVIEMHLLRGAPIVMRPLDKLNVFRGRFHRQRALTDAVLLEIEAPDIKNDIIRLEDDYGRADQPIEVPTASLPKGALTLAGLQPIENSLKNCHVAFAGQQLFLQKTIHKKYVDSGIFVSLRGGFENGLFIPGEAIDGVSLRNLAHQFEVRTDTLMLFVADNSQY